MGFRVYVTDSLKGIFNGMGGKVNTRYYDIISGKGEAEETRTAEEIIGGIRDKLKEISEV